MIFVSSQMSKGCLSKSRIAWHEIALAYEKSGDERPCTQALPAGTPGQELQARCGT
jgi:hypothetical protein